VIRFTRVLGIVLLLDFLHWYFSIWVDMSSRGGGVEFVVFVRRIKSLIECISGELAPLYHTAGSKAYLAYRPNVCNKFTNAASAEMM
jgi:hypothetical protein